MGYQNYGARCLERELIIDAGILGQVASLAKLLKFLGDRDFIHQLLELREEVGLYWAYFGVVDALNANAWATRRRCV